MIGPTLLALRQRGAEAGAPAAHLPRRDPLVPGLLRAGRGLRPRRRSRRAPCATATTTSSTARRSGPPTPTRRTGSSRSCAPTRTPKKQEGITFLLIDMETPGVSVRPIKLISGSSPFCETHFENVRVPKKNVIAQDERRLDRGEGAARPRAHHDRRRLRLGGGGGGSAARSASAREQHLGSDERAPRRPGAPRPASRSSRWTRAPSRSPCSARRTRRAGRPPARPRELDVQGLRHRAEHAPPRAAGAHRRARRRSAGRARASTTRSSPPRATGCARAATRSRAAPPRCSSTSSRSACSACRTEDGRRRLDLVLTEDQELIAKTAGDFVSEKSPVARVRELRDTNDPVGLLARALEGDGRARLGRHRASRSRSAARASASRSSRSCSRSSAARSRRSRSSRRCCSAGRRCCSAAATAQKARLAARASARATRSLALAQQEARSRYDLAASTTRAERAGAGFRLDGREDPGARRRTSPTRCSSSARTAGGERDATGITLFLVPKGARGPHDHAPDAPRRPQRRARPARRRARRRRRGGRRGRRRARAARARRRPRDRRPLRRDARRHAAGLRRLTVELPEDAPAVRRADRLASRRSSTAPRTCSSRSSSRARR